LQGILEHRPGVQKFIRLNLPLFFFIKIKEWLYSTDALLKIVLANPNAYGLKNNTTYVAGNNVAWCMYNGLSRGLRADDLLPGNKYHTNPSVHLDRDCLWYETVTPYAAPLNRSRN